MNQNDILIKIYKSALENEVYVGVKPNKIKQFKMILYYFSIIFLNRYREEKAKCVHIANGKMEVKFGDEELFNNVYYGFTFRNFKDIINMNTIVSFCKKYQRISILKRATIEYISKRKIIGGNWIYWIDFMFWDNYIREYGMETVYSNGHFDRVTTIISLLCESYSITFYMRQHGLIHYLQCIPNKIFCNKLYAFDKNEIVKFRRNIIKNDNCEYKERYVNKIKFYNEHLIRKTIGIIEQPVKEEEDVINVVINSDTEKDILVMLHPLSNAERYKKFKGISNVHFLVNRKVWNVDLLVATPSTLVYDYLHSGFKTLVLFVDIYGIMPEYRNQYDNVIYIDSIDELKTQIKEKTKEW